MGYQGIVILLFLLLFREGNATELVLSKCDPGIMRQTITFVHVNDLHAHYHSMPGEKSRYSHIAGYFRSVRRENPFSIFTNGGDDYEKGAVAEQYSRGLTTRLITEQMGFDVRVIGNHDFAWGVDEVVAYSKIPKQIALCSNMNWTGTPATAWGAVKWATITVGCVKVGFFGFTSQPWNEANQPYNGDYYPELKARYDFIDLARRITAQHREEVDILVMLSHVGKKEDEVIARAVPGIDLILGAHSHTLISSKRIVNGTLIVQSGVGSEFISRVDATVDLATRNIEEKETLLLETDSLPADDETDEFIEKLLATHAPEWNKTIAHTEKYVDTETIAGIAARAATEMLETHAAIVEVATVWNGWQPGAITPQRLYDTFPAEKQKPGTLGFNGMTIAILSGTDLIKMRDMVNPKEWKLHVVVNEIDPASQYRIAFQKRGALQASFYFPGLKLENIVEKNELWELLLLWGKERESECLHLDSDAPAVFCRDRSKKVTEG